MIATYNYPGASSFRAIYFPPTKEGRQKARDWWSAVHAANGPCAPGGGVHVSDREARTWRYMDRSFIFGLVETVDGGAIALRGRPF